MKRLFISQPMRDKTDEEILAERKKAVRVVKEMLGEDVEVIDSFFQEAPHDAKPLWYLAKSLELLATADVAFFCNGWEKYRGCRIEHTCAVEYGVRIIGTPETFEERSLTLTNREWKNVETCVMFVEKHFRKTLELWEGLAQIKDSDGNQEYQIITEKNIEKIRKSDEDAKKLLRKIKGMECGK